MILLMTSAIILEERTEAYGQRLLAEQLQIEKHQEIILGITKNTRKY